MSSYVHCITQLKRFAILFFSSMTLFERFSILEKCILVKKKTFLSVESKGVSLKSNTHACS